MTEAATAPAWVLAIDFGTSNTTAAMSVAGEAPQELRFRLEPRLPSSVLLAPDGRIAVGRDATLQRASAADRFVETPKRQVGKGSVVLAGSVVTDVDLVAAVLEAAYREAVRQRGGEAPRVVCLTHPAAWQESRLGVLREAWQRACDAVDATGPRPELDLVDEPVAAATYLDSAARVADGSIVGVLDFGGGTVDAALVRRDPDGFHMVGRAEGIDPLGGVDFDHALLRHLISQLPELRDRLAVPSAADTAALLSLLDSVREAKEALSGNATVVVRVPAFPPQLAEPADIQVTREEFRGLIGADLDRAAALLADTARRSAPDRTLDEVFLIGGTSRIPALAGIVAERTGRSPQEYGDPQLAVALGAAVIASRRTGTEPVLTTVVAATAEDAPDIVAAAPTPEALSSPEATETPEPPETVENREEGPESVLADSTSDDAGAAQPGQSATPAVAMRPLIAGALAGAVVAVILLIGLVVTDRIGG